MTMSPGVALAVALACSACLVQVAVANMYSSNSSNSASAGGGRQLLGHRANANYHIYETARFPDGRVQYGSHPGYPNVQNLYCMGALQGRSSAFLGKHGWVSAGPETGIKCGECIKIRNVRNGKTAWGRRVDEKGEGGFDFDYERLFKRLDSDNVNFLRGNMDFERSKIPASECLQ